MHDAPLILTSRDPITRRDVSTRPLLLLVIHLGSPPGSLSLPEPLDAISQPTEHPETFTSIAPNAVPRFRVALIPIGLALLGAIAIAAGAIRGFSRTGLAPYPIGQAIGAAVGLLLWPFLCAWIAYRIARRSNRAANWTFTIVLLLCFIGYATRTRTPVNVPSGPKPPSMAEIRAISEEAKKASLDGDEKRALELSAESAAKLQEVAAAAKGSEKTVMEYAALLARAQNEVLTQYITAARIYADAGAGSLQGLTDAASVEQRLALLATALSTHDGVITYFRTISDRIPQELASRGVAKKDADEFLAGFIANAKVENLLAIHAAEHGMLLAARARFNLLASSPGLWSVNPQGELVPAPAFPPDRLAEFHRLQSEIDRLADKQGELIEERKSGR